MNIEWSRYFKDYSFDSYHAKKSTNLKTTLLNKNTTSSDLINFFILGEKEVMSSTVAKYHYYEFAQDTKIAAVSSQDTSLEFGSIKEY